MITDEGRITDIYMLHVAWCGLLEQITGRELQDDEFQELLRLLKATCRLARSLPDSDLNEE